MEIELKSKTILANDILAVYEWLVSYKKSGRFTPFVSIELKRCADGVHFYVYAGHRDIEPFLYITERLHEQIGDFFASPYRQATRVDPPLISDAIIHINMLLRKETIDDLLTEI